MDNRHHWQDVLVGCLVGLGFSFFAYRQYYPPLSAPDAHLPFEPRHMNLRPPVPALLEGAGVTGAGSINNAGIGAHDREHVPGRSTSHHTDTDDVETGGVPDSGRTAHDLRRYSPPKGYIQLHVKG
jgi:hypothetical protein